MIISLSIATECAGTDCPESASGSDYAPPDTRGLQGKMEQVWQGESLVLHMQIERQQVGIIHVLQV